MSKRPVDAKGGGPGGKNRHAKRRYSPADDFKQGLQGIMITCDIHREKQAVRECFGLLEHALYIFRTHGPTSANPTFMSFVAGGRRRASLMAGGKFD